jgi:hypothetical protein
MTAALIIASPRKIYLSSFANSPARVNGVAARCCPPRADSRNMTDGKFTAHTNSAMMGTDVRTVKVKDDPLGQRLFDTINKSSAGGERHHGGL